MPFPQSLGPYEDVQFDAAAGQEPVAASDQAVCLHLDMQPQQQTLWCWAAAAASILGFYNGPPAPAQCSLASDYIRVPYCPPPPISQTDWPGNQMWHLAEVLKEKGYLTDENISGALEFDPLTQEIDHNHPVCIHIATVDGHFMVIDGYDPSEPRKVHLCDPEGKFHGYYAYDSLNQTFGVEWDETYRTCKPEDGQ